MDDRSSRPAGDDHPARHDPAAPGVPRWVKILAVVAAAILVIVGIAVASGHGPGRHAAHGADSRAVQSGYAVSDGPHGAGRV
jgi:hypothetical protein